MMRAVILVVGLSVASWTGVALGQAKSDAAAEAVFQQGLAATDRGDYAAACPLLERAIELSSTEALGGMLTLADCYERTDRPSSAWGLYRRVAARAHIAKEEDRAKLAEAAAARLEPTLPRVRFRPSGPSTPGLRVRVGDDVVPVDVWDVPIPVDPGNATFTFMADGVPASIRKVAIPSGPTTTEVVAPILGARTGGSPGVAPEPNDDVEAGATGIGAIGIAGLVVGGAGLVGLGVSAGVMAVAKGDWDDAVEADCDGDPTRCRTLDAVDAARATGTAGSAIFGVGVGLTAIGVGLAIYGLVDASSRGPTPPKTEPELVGGGGVDPTRGDWNAAFALKWRL